MSHIQQLNAYTYYMEARGNKMMLTQRNTIYGKVWEMYVDNASRRAWHGLGVKEFDTLQEVEKYYKSWKGISTLANG